MGPRKDCKIEPQVAEYALAFPNSLLYKEELAVGDCPHTPHPPPLASVQAIIS